MGVLTDEIKRIFKTVNRDNENGSFFSKVGNLWYYAKGEEPKERTKIREGFRKIWSAANEGQETAPIWKKLGNALQFLRDENRHAEIYDFIADTIASYSDQANSAEGLKTLLAQELEATETDRFSLSEVLDYLDSQGFDNIRRTVVTHGDLTAHPDADSPAIHSAA